MEKLKYGSRRWKELTSQHAWHSDKIDGKPVMVCYNNEYYYELPRIVDNNGELAEQT